jgi:chaperonin GroEL
LFAAVGVVNQQQIDMVGRLSTVIIKLEEEDAVIPAEKNVIIERDAKIAGRIQTLEAQIENETSIFEKEKAQERLAKLTQGVAVIQVGAATEAQMRERIERTKDAVSAARAAAEEGIVPGGGVAFVQLASVLKDSKTAGGKLLYETLQEPTIKLLQNAGESDENSKKIQSEIKTRGGDFGYNVTTGNVEDLVKAGVIDPAKVIRLSLENAIAVAGTILSTDCIIADKFVETPSNMQVV